MSIKKIASILSAILLTVSALSGCASDSKDQSSSSSASSSSSEASSESSKAPGEMPITDEPVTLRIFFQQEPQVLDYVDNKLTKYLEETTGIHIEWDLVLSKDKTQKLNLLLATGQDMPDVFMGGMDTPLLVEYASQGAFVPLNDYIENDSKYFQDVLKDIPDIKNLITTPDGNIYSMPSINTEKPNMMANRLWINKVWLDKLNLQMPTTTDEFRDVLKAFKEQDPNGNGKADEIPLMGATTGWNTDVETFFMNSFLPYQQTTKPLRYNVIDGKVTAIYAQDEYKEGLKYLNSLINDGLLDPSTFTQDIAQLKQIFETEENAMIGAVTSGGPNAHANINGERFKDYVAVPPLKGPNDVQYAGNNPYQYLNSPNCYVITKGCENPEAAFRFVDFMYSQDVSMRTRLGEPGTDWEEAPEGSIGVDGEPALYKAILVYGSDQKSHWQNRNPYYNFFGNKCVRDEANPYELQGYLWDVMEQYEPYLPPVEVKLPPVINTAEESKQLNQINTVLDQFVDENRVKFITSGKVDEGWSGYMKELDNIGYKMAEQLTQAAYDRYKESK